MSKVLTKNNIQQPSSYNTSPPIQKPTTTSPPIQNPTQPSIHSLTGKPTPSKLPTAKEQNIPVDYSIPYDDQLVRNLKIETIQNPQYICQEIPIEYCNYIKDAAGKQQCIKFWQKCCGSVNQSNQLNRNTVM